jgi:hypothetical protein
MSTGKGKDAGDDLPAPGAAGTPHTGGVAGGSQGTGGISGGDDHGRKVRPGPQGSTDRAQVDDDPAGWAGHPKGEDGLTEG